MDLIYYYSDSCGCCKDYSSVVDKLATELKIEAQKRNIKDGVSHTIQGVPTIIIEDENGEIFRNVGNLPYDLLIKDIKEIIDG